MVQIELKNFINKFNFELSYAIDNGQLLKFSNSTLISLNYNHSLNSASKWLINYIKFDPIMNEIFITKGGLKWS